VQIEAGAGLDRSAVQCAKPECVGRVLRGDITDALGDQLKVGGRKRGGVINNDDAFLASFTRWAFKVGKTRADVASVGAIKYSEREFGG
jgi:hypothetical protein